MRTEDECLAKAAEMERQAEQCGSAQVGAEFVYLAMWWRHVASQAAWQDAAP
jgi:hypothetical protein